MSFLSDFRSQQLSIPLLDESTKPIDNGSHFNDPTFAINKSLPIHRWVPWIAGFSSDFVSDILDRYLTQKSVVLDPFSGVGTTLVEAVLHGHDTIGFEINPYAALACHLKINAYKIDLDSLCREISRFQDFCDSKIDSNYNPVTVPPEGFKTRSPFYSPKVLRKVLISQDFIRQIENDMVRNLFQLAFASTMVSYSNYSYEPSLGRRVSAGKEEINDFYVSETITAKLLEMENDIKIVKSNVDIKVSNQIINASFFEYEKWISANSIDLLVTSPPYLNNYHYNRNTRPHLYWLGFANQPKDLKNLEEINFGKYWQTVRDLDSVQLDFELPDYDLSEKIDALKKLNTEKGAYGGKGWANYAASYFNDCYKFVSGIQYSLKSNGTALIVIGNSILQGIMIPTDQYLAQIAESVGLELVRIDIPRATRIGNSIIKSNVRVAKAKDSHQLYEAIVELRKPSSA